MIQRSFIRKILLSGMMAGYVPSAFALNHISGDMALSCQQSDTRQILDCQYSNRSAEPVLSITARLNSTNLSVNESSAYPNNDSTTAVLLLVDTSDPARQTAINKKIQHIYEILANSEKHHHFGLASFDKQLQLLTPIGSDLTVIDEAAKKLKATGSTTELYRNMLGAIALFKNIDADRKSIFLFSDGLAEDKAYFHHDVVKAANDAEVIITSIGYPRSIAQSVSLQTLRRLSEETGGAYIETSNQFNIPDNFIREPLISIDNGGIFSIDFEKIKSNRVSNSIEITLETDLGSSKLAIPVKFASPPEPSIQRANKEVASINSNELINAQEYVPQAAPKRDVSIIQGQTQGQTQNKYILENWLWYGIPIALLVLLILTIATFILSIRRQGKTSIATPHVPTVKPFAYLIAQDESKKRYPITTTTCRLGRSKDNEITLRDSSVSRRHAEIHREQGDEFTLIDLNSLNGVFINSEKIGRYKLQEGDVIEIGDIFLRFTLMSPEYQLEESTVMQDTKMPSIH